MSKQQRILLVEPKTRTSYPPLGLMKIATYHTLKGDHVEYVSGKSKPHEAQFWDKIYVTSVFTYDFKTLVDTIKYYRGNFANMDNLLVGGISATLLSDRLEEETGVKPHKGLLNQVDPFLQELASTNPDFAYLNDCGACIDNLPPDYGIFPDDTRYGKVLNESYFFYTTKGCPNDCNFCAVRTLEPKYLDYIPVAPRIKYVADRWGEKAGLLLLDNNIAGSEKFDRIIDEIKDCGFGAGAKFSFVRNGRTIYKQRFVDFNQGVDLRLMDVAKMKKMAEIAIRPLRLAFDNIKLKNRYREKMELAIECGITQLSNYMLFNHKDTPDDLYERFMVNLEIIAKYPQAKIFSFPMRFSPIERTDRDFVSEGWTRREIRALQIVLNATHGIVSHKKKFFHHAFGNDSHHFHRILLYPFHYIINREYYEQVDKQIDSWEASYAKLTDNEATDFKQLIQGGLLKEVPTSCNSKIRQLLSHYEGEHSHVLSDEEKEMAN